MRRTGVAVTAAVLVIGGVAGCGPSAAGEVEGGSAATAAAPAVSSAAAAPDPRVALRAAARKLGEQPLRMTMKAGPMMSATGVLDPRARKLDIRMEVKAGEPMTMRIVGIADDIYFRYNGKAAASLGDDWLHVDSAKLPAASGLNMMPDGDPAGANTLMSGVVQVRSTGPGRFAGTLDATRSPTADKKALEAFGAKAKKVPFTAQIDAKGRLAGIDLDMSALSPMMPKIVTRYSDFGTPVTVKRPAGAQEMPAELLRAMG